MADDSPLLSRSFEDEEDKNISAKTQKPVLFKTRWLMLALLGLLTVNSVIQWIFYSAVTKTVQRYFGVPLIAVEYLTISCMIATVIFIVPCVWLVQRTSLRTGCLLNASLNTIAALIKYFACYGPNTIGYSVTLFGQIIASIATCFILSMPAEVAAVWFSSNERSTATSVIASGHFLGISFSCFLSTVLVAGNTDLSAVGSGLEQGQIVQGVFSLILTVAIYFLFKNEPPIAPSKSQGMLDVYHLQLTYRESLNTLLHNLPYCLFLISYGIMYGSMFAFWLVAQESLPKIFHGQEYSIGMLGTITAIFGVPGMLISGIWLDKTKTYKFSLVLVSLLTVITCIAYTLQLRFPHTIIEIYIICAVFGFLVSSFISMGFIFVGEITYPVPETISSGLILISAQIFGILLTIEASLINAKLHNVVISSGTLTAGVFLAFVLVTLVKSDLKRYAEDQTNNNSD